MSGKSRTTGAGSGRTGSRTGKGDQGAADGPAHHLPLVKDAPSRKSYGTGTYGNDQFAADDDAAPAAAPDSTPEGRTRQPRKRDTAGRPDTGHRDERYGRNGRSGRG